MNKVEYQGWTAELKGKILTITKDGESREYDIKEKNNGIEHKPGEPYFFIKTVSNGFYYQFKFEEGNFFVGDKFQNNIGDTFPTSDKHQEEFACHVFGEM